MAQSKAGNFSSEASVMAAQGAIATTEGQLESLMSKLTDALKAQSSNASGSMVDTSA